MKTREDDQETCPTCGRTHPPERRLRCLVCGEEFIQRGFGRNRKTCWNRRCWEKLRRLHRMGVASL